MIKISKILVPTDFSDNSAFAYPYANSLAKSYGAEVLLAYISEHRLYPIRPGQGLGWDEHEEEEKAFVAEGLAKAREAFDADLKVGTVHGEGRAFVELVRTARAEGIDMIVICTHGHTGMKHLLLGSTAEKVVRKAPCPVLTVHPGQWEFEMP